jgi:nitrogen regulatory protein P-II 1
MTYLVTAVIKPHRVDAVKDAVKALGVQGMTVSEVKGFGRQGGHTETYRGAEYEISFVPKVKVEVLCPAEDVDRIAEAITEAAKTGKIGDGKIWASPVEKVSRIRTGEAGDDAL